MYKLHIRSKLLKLDFTQSKRKEKKKTPNNLWFICISSFLLLFHLFFFYLFLNKVQVKETFFFVVLLYFDINHFVKLSKFSLLYIFATTTTKNTNIKKLEVREEENKISYAKTNLLHNYLIFHGFCVRLIQYNLFKVNERGEKDWMTCDLWLFTNINHMYV